MALNKVTTHIYTWCWLLKTPTLDLVTSEQCSTHRILFLKKKYVITQFTTFISNVFLNAMTWSEWEMLTVLTFYQGGSRFWHRGSWAGRLPSAAGLWRPGWWRSTDGPLCRTTVWPAGAEQRQCSEKLVWANKGQKHAEGLVQVKKTSANWSYCVCLCVLFYLDLFHFNCHCFWVQHTAFSCIYSSVKEEDIKLLRWQVTCQAELYHSLNMC